MRHFILTFILFLPYSAIAQNTESLQIDSLRRIIAVQQGMEKVNSYRLLGSHLFQGSSSEELIVFFQEFETVILEEQKKEKKSQLIQDYVGLHAQLKLNHGYVFFNYGDFEKVELQAHNTIEFCRENDEWVIFYKAYDLLLDALLASNKFEAMQREAKKLFEEAKERNQPVGMTFAVSSLAKVYMKQRRLEEAEKHFRECIDLANKADFDDVCYLLVQSYRDLAAVVIAQDKYGEAFQVLQDAEAAVQRLEKRETQIDMPIKPNDIIYMAITSNTI